MYVAKPTKQQLEWHEMELGVIIHYCLDIYRPDLLKEAGDWYKTDMVRTAIAPSTIHPTKLDPEQWVRSAWELGAKYAVLVTNHCTGFSLWNTKVNDFSISYTDWRGGGGDICREFIDACKKYDKGIFVLVKTSNEGSGELQDAVTANGLTVSERLATFVCDQAEALVGSCGYSPIGAVVGATYPEEAASLRKIMPKSYFLVPGYGAQGGSAEDILPCFHADGLGAVVNSSRGILYMHMSDEERTRCTRKEYSEKVREAVLHMRRDIHDALKTRYPDMIY